MSTLKFSQFTELTATTATTYMVGYDGTDNIRIEASDLNTTYQLYSLPIGSIGASLILEDSLSNTDTVSIIGSGSVSVSTASNVITISATDTDTTNQTLSLGASPTYTLTLTDSNGGTVFTSLAALAGGSDKNYVHTQGTASATWSIVHNLNKYASVTVVDSNNVVVHGEIEYINTNEVEITFRAAFSGEAYLN